MKEKNNSEAKLKKKYINCCYACEQSLENHDNIAIYSMHHILLLLLLYIMWVYIHVYKNVYHVQHARAQAFVSIEVCIVQKKNLRKRERDAICGVMTVVTVIHHKIIIQHIYIDMLFGHACHYCCLFIILSLFWVCVEHLFVATNKRYFDYF